MNAELQAVWHQQMKVANELPLRSRFIFQCAGVYWFCEWTKGAWTDPIQVDLLSAEPPRPEAVEGQSETIVDAIVAINDIEAVHGSMPATNALRMAIERLRRATPSPEAGAEVNIMNREKYYQQSVMNPYPRGSHGATAYKKGFYESWDVCAAFAAPSYEKMREALRWVTVNYQRTLGGLPVRDADECIAAACAILSNPSISNDK